MAWPAFRCRCAPVERVGETLAGEQKGGIAASNKTPPVPVPVDGESISHKSSRGQGMRQQKAVCRCMITDGGCISERPRRWCGVPHNPCINPWPTQGTTTTMMMMMMLINKRVNKVHATVLTRDLLGGASGVMLVQGVGVLCVCVVHVHLPPVPLNSPQAAL